MRDLREIGPTHLLLAPRVWEQTAADVRARVMDANRADPADLRLRLCAGLAGAGTRAKEPVGRAPAVRTAARPPRLRAAESRPRPAAPRSAPTPSGSSSPWACRCASSTARPSCSGAYTLQDWQRARLRQLRATLRRHRDPHRSPGRERGGRDRHPPCGHVRRLFRQRGRGPRDADPRSAGCGPAMPAISTRRAGSSSSTACGTSPRPAGACASRPSTSRTSSSSRPISASAWCWATAGPSWPPSSACATRWWPAGPRRGASRSRPTRTSRRTRTWSSCSPARSSGSMPACPSRSGCAASSSCTRSSTPTTAS